MIEREAQWQARVVRAARAVGWLPFHVHDSRRSAPGFPDLVLVRDRIVFAELKTERGRLSPDQEHWLSRLAAAGAETAVWRPAAWDEVLATLARRAVG